jgi:hypothetical protein
MPASSRSRTPWITASVAGVVLAALLLVYFAFLLPAKNDKNDPSSAEGALTTTEKQAVVAGGVETVNLLSFRRAEFSADFARALAGTTGALRSDVSKKKSLTQKAMTSGKFDLGADVTHQALEGPTTGKQQGYLVLVTVNAYRSTTKTQPLQQNLEVTVVKVKGKWLASDVQNIGLQ